MPHDAVGQAIGLHTDVSGDCPGADSLSLRSQTEMHQGSSGMQEVQPVAVDLSSSVNHLGLTTMLDIDLRKEKELHDCLDRLLAHYRVCDKDCGRNACELRMQFIRVYVLLNNCPPAEDTRLIAGAS